MKKGIGYTRTIVGTFLVIFGTILCVAKSLELAFSLNAALGFVLLGIYAIILGIGLIEL